MLTDAVGASRLAKHEGALVRRFLAKLVIDVLPAAFVSVLGGFFLSQYQFAHTAAPHPTVQVVPASTEMMQLVRDEHAAIIDYLRVQTAAEKSRQAAENADDVRAAAEARGPADSETTAAAPPSSVALPLPRPPAPAATAVAAKPAAARIKTAAITMPPHAPLVVAQAGRQAAQVTQVAQADQAVAAAPPADAPSQPKSLLTRTIAIKEHMVDATKDATWHVVSAIGSIPSWIASMGDRIGGDATPAATSPAPRQFFTTSS
jgi:hypothetical protein